jgi:hypothetical protein
MFWVWIGIAVLGVVGLSVLVGRTLNKPKGAPMDRHAQITGLKASGALKHRKSNRD